MHLSCYFNAVQHRPDYAPIKPFRTICNNSRRIHTHTKELNPDTKQSCFSYETAFIF